MTAPIFTVFEVGSDGEIAAVTDAVVLDFCNVDEIADALFVEFILIPLAQQLADVLDISAEQALARLVAISGIDD